MTKTIEQLAREINDLKMVVIAKDREILYLEQQVAFFKATKYSPKSESMHPGQRELFNEAERDATETAEEVEFEVSG
ncbi:MAG: hypothetical protein H7249_16130 [Chitinophagaceae bacterium]|nr:hypothetical protein [Oligoflexus sp.]